MSNIHSNPKNTICKKISSYCLGDRCGKIMQFISKIPFVKNLCKSKCNSNNNSYDNSNGGCEIDYNISPNIENFASKTAEQVMVPRSDIVAIEIGTSLEDLCKIITNHSHTRTLVYQEKLDNVVGFLHIKDIFDIVANSRKFNMKKLLRKHLIAPQSIKLPILLQQMQIHRTHIAVVIDEYGGTDGIITIEDLIEEIVGRIHDEHDDIIQQDENYTIIKPGLIIANARVPVADIEKATGLHLLNGDEEIETIGGLIMSIAGNVPETGAEIEMGSNIKAQVVESTPRTIKRVKLFYSMD